MIPPGSGVALAEQGGRELGISAETCDASELPALLSLSERKKHGPALDLRCSNLEGKMWDGS